MFTCRQLASSHRSLNRSRGSRPGKTNPVPTAPIPSMVETDALWIDLGAVWQRHIDGKGFDIVLETVPVGGFNGRLTLRAIGPKS